MILKVLAISLVMMSSASNAYNILVVAPLPFKSHWILFERITERLLDRDYNLDVISPFKYRHDDYQNENLKEHIIPKYNLETVFPSKNFFNGIYENNINFIKAQYKMGLAVSEHTLSQQNVKELINSKDKKFDVVIVDSNHQDSLYMFAQKFKCPLVVVDVNGHSNYLNEIMGIKTPHSFVPHPATKYDKEMTYMQRCYNALLYVYEASVRKFSYIPAQNKLASKHFRDGIEGELPHLETVINKISLILSNSFKMTQKGPKMSAQVDVGGAHVRGPRDLPNDLKDLFENEQRSVIFFSLGSYIKASEIPKEKLDEIIKAFANIKETILWQFDGDVPAGLPDNVIMQKWFPQNDLLASKQTVLFITQGGTLSFQEGLSNEVPMLIIPFTGEQFRNAQQAERGHFGKMLLFDDLNEQSLTKKINEIRSDKTFFTGASKASSKLFNSPTESIKEAIFWIHHVCKHQDIEKSISVDYYWFTYYSLDVYVFYAGILLIFISFWAFTISLIVGRYRKREQKGKFKYY